MVKPHEQLWIFFEDVGGDFVGHGDNDSVVALLPSAFEAGADGFQAEDLEFFLGLLVFIELFEQRWLFDISRRAELRNFLSK